MFIVRSIKRSIFIYLPFLFACMLSCSTGEISDLNDNSLIPAVRELTATGDFFEINDRTRFCIVKRGSNLLNTAVDFSIDMESETGIYIGPLLKKRFYHSNVISLLLEENNTLGDEGYILDIQKNNILITASKPAGIYRAAQTLRQLIVLDAAGSQIPGEARSIACGRIVDYPEYAYRGTMLDVSRHFFSVEDVMRYIDLISLYKINILHLHLSDDQGWRIEIKSWPKLTEIGGSTEVGGGEGGFYTQEDYAKIVKYADERFIIVIPEIDMPGHTNSALASYAELNCSGLATELYTGTRVGFSTLCTDSEITYKFIDDVVRELAALTTGPYIHIGGDESHVTAIEDYIPFINRVQDIVHSHGKIVIGWDEITHASLKGESVAQYWASSENALRAIGQGAQIIVSPATRCYLDMKYDESSPLGLNWAAYIEIEDAYSWDPLTMVEGISKKDILGIESPLWSETIETMDDIEYLAFPRLIGHSEIGWSSPETRNWESYKSRLKSHYRLLDFLEVDYYKSPQIDE
jgi:hexosaminidase